MNILDIDVDSYATRVAYVAAAELFALLSGEEGAGFLPETGSEEETDALVQLLGAFVIRNGVEKGESVWRLLLELRKTNIRWERVEEERRFALDLFVVTLRELRGRLSIRQIELERKASLPPPNPAPAIEDTIFEPVGSMAEMEPWAAEAAALSARYERERAAERDAENLRRKTEAERQAAAALAARKLAPEPPAPLSAGKAAPMPRDKRPSVPNLPRKAAGKKPKPPAKG